MRTGMDVVRRRRLILVVLALALVVAIGRVHVVVHGGRLGVTLCHKENWGLGNTWVDVDDYIKEQPLRKRPEKQRAEVAIALVSCEAATRDIDQRDLYWQALDLTIHELGLQAHLQWVVRSYDIIASENDCKRLKPLAVRLAPPDQLTTCGDLTRTFWLVHH
jgi:hypothetical protein